MGYSDYMLKLVDEYPQLTGEINQASKKSGTIILSGVISDDLEDATNAVSYITTLPVVITFYTPYSTLKGVHTNFYYAIGPQS